MATAPKNRAMPESVKRRVAAEPERVVAADKIDRIREAAEYARAHQKKKEDLTQQLELVSADLNKVTLEVLPALMSEVGMRSFTVEAKGNAPAFDITVKPFYRASIPVDWDEDKRKAAFEHLEERHAGDIIKTIVSFEFPKDSSDRLHAFLEFIQNVNNTTPDGEDIPIPSVRQNVHHATLSSWLKEEYELSAKRGAPLPKLDLIGGMVGKIASIKDKES